MVRALRVWRYRGAHQRRRVFWYWKRKHMRLADVSIRSATLYQQSSAALVEQQVEVVIK